MPNNAPFFLNGHSDSVSSMTLFAAGQMLSSVKWVSGLLPAHCKYLLWHIQLQPKANPGVTHSKMCLAAELAITSGTVGEHDYHHLASRRNVKIWACVIIPPGNVFIKKRTFTFRKKNTTLCQMIKTISSSTMQRNQSNRNCVRPEMAYISPLCLCQCVILIVQARSHYHGMLYSGG